MKKIALFLLVALLLGGCKEQKPHYKTIGSAHLYAAKDTDEDRILQEANLICPSEYPTPCQILFFKPGTKLPDAFPLSPQDIDNLLFYWSADSKMEKYKYKVAIREDCRIYPIPPEFADSEDMKNLCIKKEEMNKLLRLYHDF